MRVELSLGNDVDRGFRRLVKLLIWLDVVPTAVLLVLGILMLVFWKVQLNLVFGILVVTLVGALVTGAVLALVMLQREAQLSKLQMDFVSKVSHELRTPLTSIRMFADTLGSERARDPEQARVCLQVLQREAARLQSLIERLLDWGRMEAGRKVYQRQPETVEAMVGEALQAVEHSLRGRRQEVRSRLQEPLPTLLADRGAMVDALVNLLINASKYSPDGAEVELGAAASGDEVRIWVSDRGIGIPRREHRNIFKKFYRVDERLSRSVEGSGLGLAIVCHVVQGHGGHIELESEPGQGSTFTIVLPGPRQSSSAV